MPVPIKDLYEELRFISDRISTQVRTIALSILAFCWLILAGSKDTAAIAQRFDPWMVSRTGVLAFAALILDYLQYLFGYLNADAIRSKAEKNNQQEIEYDYSDSRYILRVVMFWLKQAAIVAAVCLLGVTGVRAIS